MSNYCKNILQHNNIPLFLSPNETIKTDPHDDITQCNDNCCPNDITLIQQQSIFPVNDYQPLNQRTYYNKGNYDIHGTNCLSNQPEYTLLQTNCNFFVEQATWSTRLCQIPFESIIWYINNNSWQFIHLSTQFINIIPI